MKNVLYVIMFFFTAVVSGFSSGVGAQTSGTWTGYLVNDTDSCFTLTAYSFQGGYCEGSSCLENLCKSLNVGNSQQVNISQYQPNTTNPGYISLSYSVFAGTAACDSVTCPCTGSPDCCYCCGCCNGDYSDEFTIVIPYNGGTGCCTYNFSTSGTSALTVSYDSSTHTYKIRRSS